MKSKLLKSILVVIMLAWITLTSSCEVFVHTPAPRTTVVHERTVIIEHHDNGRHRGEEKHEHHD